MCTCVCVCVFVCVFVCVLGSKIGSVNHCGSCVCFSLLAFL